MNDQRYYVSEHAREEAQRRGIAIELIQQVMASPGQIVDAHSGRKVYQAKIEIDGAMYLVRVIVELGDPYICHHCLSHEQDREILEQ